MLILSAALIVAVSASGGDGGRSGGGNTTDPDTADPSLPRPRQDAGQQEKGMIARLPFARGRTFANLDAYLQHLEGNAAIDLPWWRKAGHDRYEWITSMRGGHRETATREQLLQRYGFSR